MDIIQLYQDFGVFYMTEGHKHCREGWVNVECPFCSGNPGYHLSYNLDGNYYTCWRCGWKPIPKVIGKLLNVSEDEAKHITKQYGYYISSTSKQPEVKIRGKSHKLPSNTSALLPSHKRYLEGRNFDPDYLEKEWHLLSTGPISLLDNLDYKHRILIPFIWNSQQVSFDSRDVTGKHMAKYMACPKDRELIPHKDILYGKQECWGETGICVEGPTDVWRLGVNAFATSGIKFTNRQIRIIAKTFKRVAVCFDGASPTSKELQAVEQAKILIEELKFRGVNAFEIKISGDPGSMKQSEANYLVKQLIK